MRIIAGEFRGRKLLDPSDQATRPVTDRVKQSIFDVLSPRLEEAVIYDVFAGTGSFGLEALSRGAKSCVFFEKHPAAVERLRRNLDTLGVGDRSRVETGDLFRLDFARFDPADVIFFDPPYPMLTGRATDLRALLHRLAGQLADDGLISFRQDAAVTFDSGLRELDQRNYGSMRVHFLTHPLPEAAG